MSVCPQKVRITGARRRSFVAGGTQLNCSAEAHPPPYSYRWTDAVDNTTVEGNTFTVASGTRYTKRYHDLTCTVTNIVTFANGSTQTCSDHADFQVYGRNSRTRINAHHVVFEEKPIL